MGDLFVGDDLQNRDQPESFVFGCEYKLDSSGGSLHMRDASLKFQETSPYAKADSSDGSERHWMVELDEEAFYADVSGVAE
jgi:hypothetical protein